MTKVSCQVTDWILDWLAAEELPEEVWVRDLPVTIEQLRDSSQRIDWELFVALLARIEKRFDTRGALLSSAQNYVDRRLCQQRDAQQSGLNSQRQLYWMTQRWLGPFLFPDCIGPFGDSEPSRVRLEIEIPKTDRPCSLLFPLIEIALRFAPRLLGESPAEITSHFEHERAAFTIELPSAHEEALGRETAQRGTEQAQRFGNHRYSAVTEHSGDVVVEFDQRGRVVYVSPNVAETFGYLADEAIAKQSPELIHPNDRHAVVERLTKTLQTGDSEQLTLRIRHSNASWRWVESTANAFRTETGEIRGVLIARDITDRMRVERDRRRLASIVENSSEFMAIFSREGQVLFMNEAGRHLLGLADANEAQTKTIFDCVLEDDAERMRLQILPDVLRSGRWVGEYRLKNFETDAPILMLANIFLMPDVEPGQQSAIAVVARDIGDRKAVEQALQDSEQRRRMLFENAYDLVAEINQDGQFVDVSHNYRNLLGYAPEELLGRRVDSLLHPEDQRAENANLFGPGKNSPHRFQHRDGSWRWLESHTRNTETGSGSPLTVLTSRDITGRRSAEDALRESREQLLHSQKMEAIGRLAGGVAHDFNNLLTAITGNCDLLLAEIGSDHPVRPEALEILRAAERAEGLTRQLLAFSRRQALKPKVVELNTIVANIDRLLRRLIGEDIELITSLGGELQPIKVDPGQLEQLIMNLAVNARDAMPRGGQLTIETTRVVIEAEPDYAHPGIPAGEYITLVVRDSGVGMDSDTAARAFEPFFTTKESGKGTGLGLSTAYGIVQQSQGHIRVDSAPNIGSTFSIYLPPVDELPTVSESQTIHTELRGDESILLVEDSDPVRLSIRRFLEKHGYTVLDAASGVEALRASRRHEGILHLLITDVILPKMDGRELRTRMLRLRPDIRILFMSGFSDDALSDHGVLGTDTVLVQKPFSPATLLRKIREELGGNPPRP